MKAFLRSHEFIILSAIVLYGATVAVINPEAFFTLSTLFDLLKGASIHGILALGVLLVILTGGVDLSFPAVGAFSSYVAILLFKSMGWSSLVGIFAVATVIGIVLGMFNGFLVHKLRAPAMILTLGTSNVLYGTLLFVFGSTVIFSLPVALRKFSNAAVVSAESVAGTTSLHPIVLIWLALAALCFFFLTYTLRGRFLYAAGGNYSVCERAGIHMLGLQMMVFSVVGALSAIAAVSFSGLYRMASPITFLGEELDVIAAVVLGGTSIMGGRGTVLGTLLGVLLITLMKNSLILIGIPSEWQKFMVGVLLLIGVTGPILHQRYKQKRAVKARAKTPLTLHMEKR
ncbi:ABC transporter permease [Aeromonas sp. MdU4]|uniref:ABC transporter permease n=1 Tax=Aeromonas sp. MdU4 TaxID=3342819 RepID=UPI0035BB3674